MKRPTVPALTITVAAALLLVASVAGAFGSDDDGSSSATDAGDAVAIVDFAFDPEELTVAGGATVTWTNEDGVAHTVTSDGDGPLASGDVGSGGSYEATFAEPGTYEYLCTIHPTMRGTVEVAA